MAKILVLGDSIQWGQGLADVDKIAERVAKAWHDAKNTDVTIARFAHSGADVWDDERESTRIALDPAPPPFPPALAVTPAQINAHADHCAAAATARDAVGEIPARSPLLLCQILDAARLTGDDFDLVLVDAGINDTELYNLLLPGKNQEAVVQRGRSFHPRMTLALRLVRATFPSAKVIVTGYYPIVSEQSDTRRLLPLWRKVVAAAVEEGIAGAERLVALIEQAIRQAGAREVQALGPAGLRDIERVAPFAEELGARCYEWTRAMHNAIEQAIADVDADNMRFADPDFGPEHSIFAGESLVWGLDEHGNAADPRAARRAAWCRQKDVIGFRKLITLMASIGHPTPAGAQKYAEVVIERAKELGVF